jgi:hypothetical protein
MNTDVRAYNPVDDPDVEEVVIDARPVEGVTVEGGDPGDSSTE